MRMETKQASKPISNRSKGFTLVEVVVAFALSAILFTALLQVIAPAYRMYARTRANADAQMLAGNILDTIRTTAMTATDLTATEGGVSIGRRNAFTAADGRLLYNGVAVYDDKYYDGKSISLQAEQAGENIVRVTVEVTGNEMLSATATAVISPIRRILGEEGDALAQVELDRASHASGSSGDALFNDMYIDDQGDNTGFAAYDIHQIFSALQLEALKAQADAQGTEAEKAFLAQLMDDDKDFYLAVYFPGATGQPIVYLTDVAASDTNEGNPAYFVYYDNKWYMANPNRIATGDALSHFDSRNHYNIINYLNEGSDFILVQNVAFPLPQ